MLSHSYLQWLATLPCNRRQPRNWVGVHTADDYQIESFSEWQRRLLERDARNGALARILRWLN
jgi:hypothetical protein